MSERVRLAPLPLTAGALVAALALIPFGYVVGATYQMGWEQFHELLFRPRVYELLTNTTMLVVGTLLVTVVLGVSAALAVVRTDLPFPLFWHALLCAPLAIPAFVNSYGWISLTHAVQSYGGAVLVVSLSYYPLVYLPVVAMLSTLDAATEEVAWSLGHSRTRTLFTVVLPRITPAVLGGGLLVALHVMAEFGALQLLAFQTFTTAIYGQYRSAFASEGGTVLAGVLVLGCVLLLSLELLIRGRRRLARVGRGAGRPAEPFRLGWRRIPVIAALVALVSMTLGVPTVRARALVDRGLVDGVRDRRRLPGLREHALARRGRGRGDDRAGTRPRVARGPAAWSGRDLPRALHVHRQRAARHRGRARARLGVDPMDS